MMKFVLKKSLLLHLNLLTSKSISNKVFREVSNTGRAPTVGRLNLLQVTAYLRCDKSFQNSKKHDFESMSIFFNVYQYRIISNTISNTWNIGPGARKYYSTISVRIVNLVVRISNL